MRDQLALQRIERQAEREMTAFLRATAEDFGSERSRQAGDSWLHAMHSLAWPRDNHERFFRRVTILAMSQLLHGMDGGSSSALSGVRSISKSPR
jgi:hypothetical protein